LKNTGKDTVISGIYTLKIENKNNKRDPTMEVVRESLLINNFEVEIDGSSSATKQFECAESLADEYRSDTDGSKVPLMDGAVP
jgi:hypothetical protein